MSEDQQRELATAIAFSLIALHVRLLEALHGIARPLSGIAGLAGIAHRHRSEP